ncbi:MAG: FtsW/RodA/SpoVE family cell cycle protein [Patescibacteria group bacterium]|nr:FtsW/RodA/SpoVE family cell cycle protein [Patescibacteria group bacterium]
MRINLNIFFVLLILMFFSLSTLFSIGKTDEFIKGIIFWTIGFLIFLSSIYLRYTNFFRYPHFQILYFLIILSLISLFILPSKERMWFSFYGFSLQPSEFARLPLLISLSIFLSKNFNYLKNNFYFLLSFLTIFPFFILIFFQPDFGMVFLFIITWFLSVVSFLRLKQIFYLIIIFCLILIIGWQFILKDYQKERILTFINPHRDPLGAGYNINQLRITIGSAGFWGKGFGEGTQAKLGFLPSAETDFILASFIEERGFLGFFLYSFLIFIILKTIIFEAQFIKNPLGQVYSYILTIHLGIKFLLTIAINLGFFPIIGLAVPFMSYGGSHLITDFLLLSLWQNFRYD